MIIEDECSDRNISVVLCDDNPKLIKALCKQIDRDLPECTIAGTARNGTEGLELIRKYEPEIVVTDILMPGLNGLEMIEQCREEGFSPLEILITGYDEFEYAYRATKLGVFDFLMKPIDPAEFLDTLNRGIERYHVTGKKESESVSDPYIGWRKRFFSVEILEADNLTPILREMTELFGSGSEEFIRGYQVLQYWIGEWMVSHSGGSSVHLIRTPMEIKNRSGSIQSEDEALADLKVYLQSMDPKDEGYRTQSPLVSKALRLLHQTDPRELTLAALAGNLDVSAAYLGDQIKKNTGETFSEIAHKYRLRISLTLLATTTLSVKEISSRIGFSGYRYFEKVFRKALGQSPTGYRKCPENQFLYTT